MESFSWVIDRTPDYNIINNITNNNQEREYIYTQIEMQFGNDFYYELDQINRENIHHNMDMEPLNITTVINNFNYIIATETDDFIPFAQPITQNSSINFVLENVTILFDDELNCCICMEIKENHQICQLNCSHKFCSECMITNIRRNRNYTCCPLCRTTVTNIIVQTQEDFETFQNI